MATEMDASLSATLLEEADPVIRGAIRKKLRVTLRASDTREQNLDALDLLGEVQLKLLALLRKAAEEDGNQPGRERGIAAFRAYAATVAYNSCADYLRMKYPQRTSLKNCLRRLLDKTSGYAAWNGENGEWMCGFAGWQHRSPAASAETVQALQRLPEALAHQMPLSPASGWKGKDWLRLLDAVFDHANGPLTMDDLLTVVAGLTGMEDVAQADNAMREDDGAGVLDNLATQLPDPYSSRLTSERLKLYWGAVLLLLPWHRAAYLLNLRDGDLDALPYYGVVSIEGIGEAIELKPEQMTTLEQQVGIGPASGSPSRLGQRFAACWRYLPLEDTIVALVLQVTRPQVIGYRNKARERLARSLKEWM